MKIGENLVIFTASRRSAQAAPVASLAVQGFSVLPLDQAQFDEARRCDSQHNWACTRRKGLAKAEQLKPTRVCKAGIPFRTNGLELMPGPGAKQRAPKITSRKILNFVKPHCIRRLQTNLAQIISLVSRKCKKKHEFNIHNLKDSPLEESAR